MKMRINLFEMIKSISLACDLVNQKLSNHHDKVTTVSYFIGKELGISKDSERKLILASLFHDIGGLSLEERLDTLNFEISPWNRHGEVGGKIFQNSCIFSELSKIIYNHHRNFKDFERINVSEEEILLSQIVNVSDRFVVLARKKDFKSTYNYLRKFSGRKFMPLVIEALGKIYKKDIFVFEFLNNGIRYYEEEIKNSFAELNMEEIEGFFNLMSDIIDFKSPFTCAHSLGISKIAETLGYELGLKDEDTKMVKLAGIVHDIGKIAIPSKLINKKGKLTKRQYEKMKSHIYYSCQILRNIKPLRKVYDFAVHHHERLDGSGYPFGYKSTQLSIGAKIMAVSDVYMALMEDRPYRKGLTKGEAKKIMYNLKKENKLDCEIVEELFRKRIYQDLVEENKKIRKKIFSEIVVEK